MTIDIDALLADLERAARDGSDEQARAALCRAVTVIRTWRGALVELSVAEHYARAGGTGQAATRRVQQLAAKALRVEVA